MVCGTSATGRSRILSSIPGGLGNLLVMVLVMAQAGFLSHADTVDSLTLMAKEIMPRLKEYKQPEAAQIAAA